MNDLFNSVINSTLIWVLFFWKISKMYLLFNWTLENLGRSADNGDTLDPIIDTSDPIIERVSERMDFLKNWINFSSKKDSEWGLILSSHGLPRYLVILTKHPSTAKRKQIYLQKQNRSEFMIPRLSRWRRIYHAFHPSTPWTLIGCFHL